MSNQVFFIRKEEDPPVEFMAIWIILSKQHCCDAFDKDCEESTMFVAM